MVFNSLQFMAFFVIVTILYFVLPHKFRWFMLLLSSCYFYMAFKPIYILILITLIVVDYINGRLIEKMEGSKKRVFLIISIIANIGMLFVFKYFNFFNGNFASIADFFGIKYPISALKLILPIGLSFHTFQSLSYIIEVYKGNQKAEKNLGIYAVYVMFYPQLVAGPIERPQNVLHQFYEKHTFDYNRVREGLTLMLWGFFKKIVIADNLSIIVNQVYDNSHSYTSRAFIVATIFFAYQIYCDFSGYSDIALGAAKVMGFRLMVNFNRPYIATSISDFWRRWHISLSSWLKDYVYIPLGGNRKGKIRTYFNLFMTFLLSGLWHGASWNYVIWGCLNGIYQIFSRITKNIREKVIKILHIDKVPHLHKGFQIVFTFSLICFTWIFFRAKNLTEAFYVITHLFNNLKSPINLPLDKVIFGFIIIIVMELVYIIKGQKNLIEKIFSLPYIVRLPLLYILIFAIIILGVYGTNAANQQFIYFQF